MILLFAVFATGATAWIAHVLLSKYIPQQWISDSWSALGGGEIVHIKQVDVHRISRIPGPEFKSGMRRNELE
jgi:hypothetical protein